mgnify:CR=1 FL=1
MPQSRAPGIASPPEAARDKPPGRTDSTTCYRSEVINPITVRAVPVQKRNIHNTSLEPRLGLSNARLHPAPVEVVLLPEFLAIRGIHLVEPLHEIVRDLVAEGIVEALRESGRHRDGAPQVEEAPT